MKRILIAALAFTLVAVSPALAVEPVHMANGIKIGEVNSTSAIIWTRLTRHPERNVEGKPFAKRVTKDRRSEPIDNLDEMEGAVPGVGGEVRLTYWSPRGSSKEKTSTNWEAVDGKKNFTRQIWLKYLSAGTAYRLLVEGRPTGGEAATCSVAGAFRTPAAPDAPSKVKFCVVTGQDYPRRDDPANGHRIYPLMQKLDPDFFVHTGDIEYYDKPAPYADTVQLARFKWDRIYSMPYQRAFHNKVGSYFMKDDHDTLKNDCWPGQNYGDLTWEHGLELFREQVPMGEKTFRTVRWGKDLQIWLVEGRDFRSPNKMPDGPNKTIWGAAQKKWFYESVAASDATFRVLISPTPIVGPDRGKKNDNHANKGFTTEGNEIRDFIGAQKGMFVICGDRHWQYVSVDPKSGVREYSCGPTADSHAGGFSEDNRSPMHQYLKVVGGFLGVEVDRVEDRPQIRFRHYAVDGTVNHDDLRTAE